MLPALLTDTVTPDLDRALHYTLMWGLEGVELRTVGAVGDRVPFVNEEKLRRRLDEHELPPVAVVPGLFEGAASDRAAWLNEVATFDETLRFCKRLGCTRVVTSAFAAWDDSAQTVAVDAFQRLGKAAARQGVTIAVLNESDGAYPTGAALADLLMSVNHDAVRAAWSPAAAVMAGEDPYDGLSALTGLVELVRCWDTREEDGGWTPAPLGEGAVDWKTQLHVLADHGYAGPLSLEVHVEPRPRQGLHDASALVRLLREARKG